MELKKSCYCCECIWQRLIENQGSIFLLAGGKNVSYSILGNNLEWVYIEPTQDILYSQSRENIYGSINARLNNFSPSNYPGSAKSYKWALLNDSRIWLS